MGMNARKGLFILGGIALALIIAIVAVALFTFQKMENEKNVKQTEKARRIAEQNRKTKNSDRSEVDRSETENKESFETLEQLVNESEIKEVT